MTLPERRVGPVSREKMKQVALFLDDPNPIHFDPDAVRRMGLGDEPINQGPSGMGYVLDMLIDFCGRADAIRRFECRLHGNVFAGDELTAGGTVAAIDEETVSCDVWLKRHLDVVLSGTAVLAIAESDE
ncbi:MAG: MaoC/PaaZ C-terminal domain-containing protein [Pseudomonadota bacterium]